MLIVGRSRCSYFTPYLKAHFDSCCTCPSSSSNVAERVKYIKHGRTNEELCEHTQPRLPCQGGPCDERTLWESCQRRARWRGGDSGDGREAIVDWDTGKGLWVYLVADFEYDKTTGGISHVTLKASDTLIACLCALWQSTLYKCSTNVLLVVWLGSCDEPNYMLWSWFPHCRLTSMPKDW